jgi:hypothetical protein
MNDTKVFGYFSGMKHLHIKTLGKTFPEVGTFWWICITVFVLI